MSRQIERASDRTARFRPYVGKTVRVVLRDEFQNLTFTGRVIALAIREGVWARGRQYDMVLWTDVDGGKLMRVFALSRIESIREI